MAVDLVSYAIQTLFVMAITGLAFKFLLWPLLRPFRWAIGRLARRRRHRHRPQRQRFGQPPPPDSLEVAYVHDSPYSHTPLSDELASAVQILLVLYGQLGIDPDTLANQLGRVRHDTHLRPLMRIKAAVDDLALYGIEDDLAATAYLMDLSARLRAVTARGDHHR